MTMLALLTFGAHAETFTIDGVTYATTTEDMCKITGSTDDLPEDLVIPATVTFNDIEYRVKEIANYAFRGKKNVKTIDGQAAITSMGSNVFQDMTQLVSIKLPEGLQTISGLFYGCSMLESIEIPSTVTRILSLSFAECTSLKEISLPEGLQEIGESAFRTCSSLESITLPSTVSSLGNGVFDACSKITSILIPEGVTSLGNNTFRNCNSLESIELPSTLTKIGEKCFSGCGKLMGINLPSKVNSLGTNCFYNCISLKEVIIPEGVTKLNDRTFDGCKALESVSLPSTLSTIGTWCFSGCKSLKEIELPESITSMNSYVFYGCTSLKKITIPSKMTRLSSQLFDGCTSLENVILPESITLIMENAFRNCTSLKTIDIPKSVTSFGVNTFENCTGLESISIPEGVKTVNSKCFLGCTALKSVILPSSLTEIAGHAFSGCTSLSTIEIPEGVTTIGTYAFQNCKALESVNLPSTISKINSQCFIDCSALTSIVIPDAVTTLENEVFLRCSALKDVTIGKNVSKINFHVFWNCNAIETVTCRNLLPPTMEASGFTQTAYSNAVLKVYYSCENVYRNNATWSQFTNIEPVDFGYTSTFDTDEWEIIKRLSSQLRENGWTGEWNLEVGPNIVYQIGALTVQNDHVVGINLPSSRVSAEALATILEFPMVRTINVSGNGLTGDIAELIDESVTHSNLTTLNIANNRMSGNLAWVNERFPALTTLTANSNGFSSIDPCINAKTLNIDYQTITEPIRLNFGKMDRQEAQDAIHDIFLYVHYKKAHDTGELLSITSTGDNLAIRPHFVNENLVYEPLDYRYYPYTFKIGGNYIFRMSKSNGSSGYAPVIFDFVEGDCNCDAVCDITDLQSLVNYVLGYSTYRQIFNEQIVNFDGNETLNVLDIIGLVNHLLNNEAEEEQQSRAAGDETAEVQEESRSEMRIEGDRLLLDTDKAVSAIDFTIKSKEGFALSSTLKNLGFTSVSKRNGNTERVIVYSAAGAQIPAGVTTIGSGNMTDLSACLAASPEGKRMGIIIGRETSAITETEAATMSITIGQRTFAVPSNYDGARWTLYDTMGRLISKGTVKAAEHIAAPPASSYILVLTKEGEENYSLKINL